MNNQRMQPTVRVAVAVGDHPAWTFFWAVIGISCATISPLYMPIQDQATKHVLMVCILVWAVILYLVARTLRTTDYMRIPPEGWVYKMLGNFTATSITMLVTELHGSTQEAVILQVLVAISVFGLMEMGRPVIDYGLLQYFLRLPLQTAIVCCGRELVGWYALTGLVLVFGTVWQSFYVHLFKTPETPGPEGINIARRR